MAYGPGAGLNFAGHPSRRGQPAGVVLVVVEAVRRIRYGTVELGQVEVHGVVVAHREDGQPPVDLLGGGAVPGVAMPREGERDSGVEMPEREGRPGLRQVVVSLLGR